MGRTTYLAAFSPECPSFGLAARFFGKHRLICPRDERSRALAGMPFHHPAGRPDLDRGKRRAGFPAHFQGIDGGGELGGLAAAVFQARMGKHDAELVPAEAADDVGFPRLGEEDVGDFQEHAVAGGMAVDVVDLLEIVQIDENQGQRRLETARQGDFAAHFPLEGAAVEDRAEGVIVGQERRVRETGAQGVGLFAQGDDFFGERLDRRTGTQVQMAKIDPQRVDQGALFGFGELWGV